jgi:hypothetical protein
MHKKAIEITERLNSFMEQLFIEICDYSLDNTEEAELLEELAFSALINAIGIHYENIGADIPVSHQDLLVSDHAILYFLEELIPIILEKKINDQAKRN